MPEEPFHRTVLRAVVVVLAVLLAIWLVYLLRKPLGWLMLALFLAVAMSGPVNLLHRRMRRGAAIALSYLGLLLVPLALIAVITPSIVNGVEDLAKKAPDYAAQLRDQVNSNPRLHKLDDQYGVSERIVQEAQKLPNRIGDAASILTNLGIGFVNSVFAAVTILILSIFMVAGGRGWVEQLLETQPPDRASAGVAPGAGPQRQRGRQLRGRRAAAGDDRRPATFVVLLILGVPFAAPLAVVTAALDADPAHRRDDRRDHRRRRDAVRRLPDGHDHLGDLGGGLPAAGELRSSSRASRAAPSTSTVRVIVSVLFGSTLFGIVGALLAVPVAATIQILGREYMQYRRDMAARGIVEPG